MSAAFKKIAFIGLGQMGLPMARKLIAAAHPVTGFDLSERARQDIASAGASTADTLAEAIAGSDCIITMLPNGKIVQDVLLSDQGLLTSASPGALILEMSSSAPTETRELAARLPAGIRIVDAPVSGGVKRAVEGTLTIMAGGCDADIEQARPLLEAFSSKLFACGPVGAGHATKAINNFVSGAGVVAAIEAVRLGSAFGLDAETLVDVLNASSGRNNATEVKMKQFVLSGSFGSGFALGLMAKDIRTAAQLSRELGLEQRCLAQTADTWDAAARELGGGVDHTEIFKYLRGR